VTFRVLDSDTFNADDIIVDWTSFTIPAFTTTVGSSSVTPGTTTGSTTVSGTTFSWVWSPCNNSQTGASCSGTSLSCTACGADLSSPAACALSGRYGTGTCGYGMDSYVCASYAPTTRVPTFAPTRPPTLAPTHFPTFAPSFAPTRVPTSAPTFAPTARAGAPTTAMSNGASGGGGDGGGGGGLILPIITAVVVAIVIFALAVYAGRQRSRRRRQQHQVPRSGQQPRITCKVTNQSYRTPPIKSNGPSHDAAAGNDAAVTSGFYDEQYDNPVELDPQYAELRTATHRVELDTENYDSWPSSTVVPTRTYSSFAGEELSQPPTLYSTPAAASAHVELDQENYVSPSPVRRSVSTRCAYRRNGQANEQCKAQAANSRPWCTAHTCADCSNAPKSSKESVCHQCALAHATPATASATYSVIPEYSVAQSSSSSPAASTYARPHWQTTVDSDDRDSENNRTTEV
jgi:hypothetical protein